ncbi:MAG: phage tail protein [bacterium]
MARTISSAILTESNKSRLRAIDLMRVIFPSPENTVYWGSTKFVWAGNTYLPRIISVGNWTRSVNPETEDIQVTLANADGEITRLYNSVDFELADVTLIRVYPDINEAIDPLWSGWGSTLELGEENAEWNINFGFRSFTQRGLRKIALNCWKKFADGVYCKYDGTTIGFATALTSGIDSSVTSFNVDEPDRLDKDDRVIVDSEEMKILTGLINPVTVTRGINGTAQASHSAAAKLIHNSCNKSRAACERRRMYGPPLTGGDNLRYFGGWTEIAPLTFKQRNKPGIGIPKFFQQKSIGNEGIFGQVIPAIYGNYRMRDVGAAGFVDAREFRHGIFLLCEGTIGAIASNLVRMNGLPQDDVTNPNDSKFKGNVIEESLMVWFGGTAQRQSLAVTLNVQDSSTDTYLNNPHLFNLANGDGPSLSDLAVVRVRIEEGGNDFDENFPTLDIQLLGRVTKLIQSYIDNNPSLTTKYPNPIEVAFDYLVNGKFGGRLNQIHVDTASASTESAYCNATLTPVDVELKTLTGIVDVGPNDVAAPGRLNWIISDLGEEVDAGSLAGRTIRITTVGKEQTKVIINNRPIRDGKIDPRVDNEFNEAGFVDEETKGTSTFQRIVIDNDWDAGKIPTFNDTFTITGTATSDLVHRFKFNGAITDDAAVERQLAAILDNCNGFYFNRGQQLVFGIRKAVDTNAVDALPWLKDYGSDRNIMRTSDGVSTLRVSKVSAIDGVANQIDVTYEDVKNGFQETLIHIFDEDEQLKLGKVQAADDTRIVNSKQLRLIGTIQKDQALRLGALKLREEKLKRDSYIFSMTLKDSVLLEPGDVRRLDSLKVKSDTTKQLSKQSTYIRIIRIIETSKFTAEIEAHKHDNAIYDDGIDNVAGGNITSGNPENPANFPQSVTPSVPVESIVTSNDGTSVSEVSVEVTYP